MKKLRVLALGICLSIALLGTAAAQGAKESAAPISCFDSCFVIDAAGDLYGWGSNLWGTNFSADKYGKQALILKDAVSVASGQWSAFAINSKGELWGWGSTQFGLLPDTFTGKPVHVMDGVKAVAIGSKHIAALKTDGSLWSWGSNDNAQMAGKTTADRVSAGSPIQIMSNIAALAAVGDTTYALTMDGKLYGWGDAVVTASGCGPVAVPTAIMKDVKSLAAIHQGLLVIKSDDSLWGKGATALLADEGCTYAKFTKLLDNVAVCNPGIAIQKDGSLLTWGSNHSGQLADGSSEHRCAPTKVADGILYAETGLNGTMAIRDNGELVVAGEGATTAGFHVVLQNAMLPSTASRIDRGNAYIPYVDITEKDWFYPYAKQCREHGLVSGMMEYNGLNFRPQGVFNDWQIVTVAVRLYCSYNQVALPDTNGALTWWRPYMDAAAQYGLISQEESAQGECDQEGMELFARLLTDIFPASYFPAINSIEKLPDVDVSTDLGKRILLLYNAGVLTGSDEYGRFNRQGNPTYRSEAAAVISRVIQPQLRVEFTPKALIPPVRKECFK